MDGNGKGFDSTNLFSHSQSLAELIQMSTLKSKNKSLWNFLQDKQQPRLVFEK